MREFVDIYAGEKICGGSYLNVWDERKEEIIQDSEVVKLFNRMVKTLIRLGDRIGRAVGGEEETTELEPNICLVFKSSNKSDFTRERWARDLHVRDIIYN